MKALKRKPKTLTEDPSLFEAAGGRGGGGLVLAAGPRRPGRGTGSRGSTDTQTTDEQGSLATGLPDGVVDPVVLARAREIAARLSVPQPRLDTDVRRGSGALRSVRYAGDSDEIDLDATLERLVEHPYPSDDDIVVRQRQQARRSLVLVVDVSGSMRGERVRTAAATVGAVVGRLSATTDLGVVAFWSDAALLVPLGQPTTTEQVLDRLLRLPAQGLTNVDFPLQVAARQLAGVPARDARVLLLSDCVHNAGPDPRPFAARLPRLDILLDTTGEQDPDLARDLVRLGRGRLRPVRTYRDVAPALSDFFAN
jgi:Mg-chelatase subunit ChlD